MCFLCRETHITRDMRLLGRGNAFHWGNVFAG